MLTTTSTLTNNWDRMTQEQRCAAAGIDLSGHKNYAALTGFLVMGKVRFDDKWRTAATNGSDEYYAPSFMAQQNRKQWRYLRAHECLHKMLKHCSDYTEVNRKYGMLANMAQDYVINLMIEELDTTKTFVERPTGAKPLIDAKYKGMGWLEVLRDLIKNNPDYKPGEEGEAADGPQAGVGEEGGPMDSHLPLPAEVDRDAHNKTVDAAVRQGKFLADKLAGRKGAGGPLDVLVQPRQTDWRGPLRDFLSAVCEGDEYSTFSPPNKKFQQLGIVLPSHFDEAVGELVIACDTSGSMGSIYPVVFGEIARIVQTTTPESVRVIWWDTCVAGEQVFKPAQYGDIARAMQPKGGGGTSPGAVVDYMRAKKYAPIAVVWLTDGYLDGTEGQARGLGVPQLWGVVDNVQFVPPVGKLVRINSAVL